MMRPFQRAVFVLLACLILAGCGQKGKLYIPSGEKPEQPGTG